jgi:hypothetical protein
MPSWLSFLGPLLRLAADVFDGENSADMVKAKKAQNDQKQKEQVETDIAKQDSGAVGRDIS